VGGGGAVGGGVAIDTSLVTVAEANVAAGVTGTSPGAIIVVTNAVTGAAVGGACAIVPLADAASWTGPDAALVIKDVAGKDIANAKASSVAFS